MMADIAQRDRTEMDMPSNVPALIDPDLIADDAAGLRLLGGKCDSCGALSFPRAEVCSQCLSVDVAPHPLAREGVLYSYSVVHQAPAGWTVPYVLGYVDLVDGVRILAHIQVPPEQLIVDLPVTVSRGVVGHDGDGPRETYIFISRT